MNLTTKRWIVNIVSLAVGAAVTYVTVYLYIPLGPITIGFGTTADHFAYSNVAILFISVAALVWIWLDYFLDTQYLKS